MSTNCRARGLMLATAAILLSSAAAHCGAQENPHPVSAPPSADFIRFTEAARTGTVALTSDDRFPLGLIPSPVDLSHTAGMQVFPTSSPESLPSSYDMRIEASSKLPPVKNQGGCGTCWAFACYGSLESCLLPGQSFDFSENHLKNTHGFDYTCCNGGTHLMTVAYLARWSGPVLEAADPYDTGTCASPTGLNPVIRVENVHFIPDRAGPLDNANIKQAVMSCGAVYTTFYWSGAYFNSANSAYYNPVGQTANHAVCIIGWDDSFPKTRFNTQPPGDGAFVARNSWGAGWGENGYFYISYYDAKIGQENVAFNSASSLTDYDRIYQYDPLGWVGSTGFESNTAWFANVFTAQAAGEVRAVGFYTPSPNSSYEVQIHLSPNSGPINTSGPAMTQTGSLVPYGYHTIPLITPTTVSAGQKFSVVVKLNAPGCRTPIAYEYPMSTYSSRADSNPGESYISYNGSIWTDIRSTYARANVCLKAYTNDYELEVSPSAGLEIEGFLGGPFSPSSKDYVLTNPSSGATQWLASAAAEWLTVTPAAGTLGPGQTTTVTVSLNSNALILPTGCYTASAHFDIVGQGHGSASRQVSLKVADNYRIHPAPCAWIDPTNHSGIVLTDDGVSSAQTLPFEFRLFQKSYTSIYVSANGMVGFACAGLSRPINTDIPNSALPNAVLYAYWDNLNPAAGGSVRIGTVGTSPDRKLVVSWVQVPLKSNPASKLSFQVVLCEDSNDIIFQYLDVAEFDTTYGAGRGATIGLEKDNGSVASKYSYNGSTLLHRASALRFTDRGPEIPEVKILNEVTISLSRQIVSASFPGVFYIESDDRVGGIAVRKTNHGMSQGMRSSLTGLTATTTDGERCIDAVYVRQDGLGTVSPLMMSCRALGGADWPWGFLPGSGQQGVEFGFGLNNIGLLVRIGGRVRSPGADFFYVEEDALTRVKVLCPPGVSPPPEDAVVAVTGISSCERSGPVLRPLLRVRTALDITQYP